MKKVLTILLFLLCTKSYSQGINFYVKGGLNISNTKFSVNHNGISSDRDYDNRFSFNIGGALDFFISKNKKTALQIELLYSRHGYTLYTPSIPYRFTFELDQISIPILVKLKVLDKLYILTGGYLGYVINAREDNSSVVKFKQDGYDNIDYGISLGLQYQFDFGGFIDTRYNLGIADVSSVEFPKSSIEWVYKNRFFQLGIGYQF